MKGMTSVTINVGEKVIREGLKKHIPWQRLGIGQVYVAEQAKQALEICSREKPDIIVSDIRMLPLFAKSNNYSLNLSFANS